MTDIVEASDVDERFQPKGQTARILGTVYAMTGLDVQPKYFVDAYAQFVDWNAANIVREYNRTQPEYDWRIHYLQTGARFANIQRSQAAEQCEGDWLFFLDTDMAFAPEVLARMLMSMETITQASGQCDVLTGLYVKRDETRLPLIYRYQSERELWYPILDFPWDAPFRVDGSGAGLLFIRKQAIDMVRQRFAGQTFQMMEHYDTEDLCFFVRCWELKLHVWCDPDIRAAHGYQAFAYPDDFRNVQAAAIEEAERDGRLYRPVGSPRWLSVQQASQLTGRPTGEIAVAIANQKLSARHTPDESVPVSVDAVTLMQWHERGAP